jgi:hypothetical protein
MSGGGPAIKNMATRPSIRNQLLIQSRPAISLYLLASLIRSGHTTYVEHGMAEFAIPPAFLLISLRLTNTRYLRVSAIP